jgi:hypothetical protein
MREIFEVCILTLGHSLESFRGRTSPARIHLLAGPLAREFTLIFLRRASGSADRSEGDRTLDRAGAARE